MEAASQVFFWVEEGALCPEAATIVVLSIQV